MDGVNDLSGRGYRTQKLVRGGEGNEARGAIDKLGKLETWQLTRAQVWLGPAGFCLDLRKRRVQRRWIQLGEHHRGIAAQQRTGRLRQGLVQHGQGRAKHHAVRLGPGQIRYSHACGGVITFAFQTARRGRGGVGAAWPLLGGHCGGHPEGSRHAGGDALRNLGHRVRVEVGPTIR